MVVPGSATEGFPEEVWAMGASSGSALPRLIFQKSRPFLRLLVREGSVSSEEALCVNPGWISPWKRLSHCLRPDLGDQGRESESQDLGVSPGFHGLWDSANDKPRPLLHGDRNNTVCALGNLRLHVIDSL